MVVQAPWSGGRRCGRTQRSLAAQQDDMNRLETALTDVLRALRELGRKYALVGGLAVSARAEPRLPGQT